MKLGIHVNKDRHLKEIIGFTRAAVSKGHEVIIFVSEEGVSLLNNPELIKLHDIRGVSMSYCDYSAKGVGIIKEVLPAKIVSGSQMNNAVMVHEADRVIIL